MKNQLLSRRSLLQSGLAATTFPLLPTLVPGPARAADSAGDSWGGLKMGVASYTLRTLPVDAAIKAILKVGLKYVSIKDMHLPMKSTPEERRAVIAQFKAAGITPLSCGVVNLSNDEAAIRQAFEYTRDCGLPTMVCNPDPASLAILDRLVKEFDIRLAIHNHGPGDKRWPSPFDVMKNVESLDRRIGVCIDVGHTARAKVDSADAIRKIRDRVYDLHLKDIDSTEPTGNSVEGGRGVLDFASIFRALQEIRYSHLIGIEYEKDANDPIPGLAETVGYSRAILRSLRKA